MKITFVAPRFHTNHSPIVEYLIKNNHIVHFFVVDQEFSEYYRYLKPINIVPSILYTIIKNTFKLNSEQDRKYLIPKLSFVISFFSNHKPDLLIIRNPHYFYSLTYLILGKIFGIKVLIYSLDPVYCSDKKRRWKFYDTIARILNVNWISPVLGHIGERRISKQIHYVPLAINLQANQNKICEEVKELKIIMVGKFLEWKRHIVLIEAVRELIEKGYKINLTIIGENTKPEHHQIYSKICKFISEFNLDKIVQIFTNINYENIFNFYMNSDIFVLPSENERYGVSTLEALSCGLPVIIGSDNGFRFNIQEGKNGFIFKSNDVKDLRLKIELFFKPGLLREMNKFCVDYVLSEHSPVKYLNNILKLYERKNE